jgi:hypothetical protein
MDFLKVILDQKNNKRDSYITTVIRYKDDKFVVNIDDKEYEVLYHIQKYNTLYSLPTNNLHPAWTKRTVKSIPRPDIVIKSWSAFKPNQRIKGYISDSKFIIVK